MDATFLVPTDAVLTTYGAVENGWEWTHRPPQHEEWKTKGRGQASLSTATIVIARPPKPDPNEIIMVGLKRSTIEAIASALIREETDRG